MHRNNGPRLARSLAILATVLLVSVPLAAAEAWWSEIVPTAKVADRAAEVATRHLAFKVDEEAFRDQLAGAPLIEAGFDRGVVFELPTPDGGSLRFRVVEDPVLSRELAAYRPDARTYSGVAVDHANVRVRFGITDQGVHAGVHMPGGGYMLSGHPDLAPDVVLAFHDADRAPSPWTCGVDAEFDPEGTGMTPVDDSAMRVGETLRTYRFAMNATGEFTQAMAGGVPAVENLMISLTNLMSALYTNDFSLRFELVGMNIYTNPATDPFSDGTSLNTLLLNQSTSALNNVVGSGNYDAGHIISYGPSAGGLAYVGMQCVSSYKGGSGTLLTSTTLAGIYDIMIHEVGHLCGATHSFNGSSGGCSGNRTASSAYEIGSGVTIMSYAGLCATENVESSDNDVFNVGAWYQIRNKILSVGGFCGSTAATGNTPPSVSSLPSVTVPRETAFSLTAVASDAEGDDLTYSWEQYDLGSMSPPVDPSSGPTFRNFDPTPDPTRSIPFRLGVPSPWEILPTVDRTLNFRVLVRDNNPAGGGVAVGSQQVIVSGAPFRVTAPNGGESFEAGEEITVTWDMGGTTDASVCILISTDAGLTWEEVVPATANDGSAQITLPCVEVATCRIRVAGNDEPWFDDSNGSFTTTAETQPPVIDCPTTFTVLTTNPDGITDTDPVLQTYIDVVTVTDNCTDPVVPTFFFPATMPIGDHVVAVFALDDNGNQGICTTTLTVELDPDTDASSPANLPYGIAMVSPNPFNPRTEIRFNLEREQPVCLDVFDTRGRRVVTLVDEPRTSGMHTVAWEGLDTSGRRVRSGVYVLRLETADGVDRRRLVLLK